MPPNEHTENHSEKQLSEGVSVQVRDLTIKKDVFIGFSRILLKMYWLKLHRILGKCLKSVVKKLLQIVDETDYILFLGIWKVNTTFKGHWKHQKKL